MEVSPAWPPREFDDSPRTAAEKIGDGPVGRRDPDSAPGEPAARSPRGYLAWAAEPVW